MRKSRKSSSVIHVHIRSSKNIHLTSNGSIHHPQKSHINLSVDNMKKASYSSSTTNIQPYHLPSSEIVLKDDHPQSQSFRLTETDVTENHHRNVKKHKKKIYSKKFVIASIIITLMISIIVIAILLGLFLKSNKQIMTSSSIVPSLRWNTSGITIAGISSVAGNASNQLNQPQDISLIYPNLLYIADYNNHRIQKYELGSFIGTTVAGEVNGFGGVSSNQLKHPSGIFIDSSNGIFISDTDNNRVQYWSNGASTGITVAGSSTGTSGNTNSTFNGPVGLVHNEVSGTLYIADLNNNRVMSYLFNASSGSLAAGSNMFGTAPTQLWKPAGIYLDTLSNSLVIANHNAKNIVRWILGTSNWTLLAGDSNAVSGNNATLLNYPQHITFDPMGNLYVVDKNNHRIQLFMVGQMDGITIAGITSTSGLNSTLLNTPHAIKLDNQLNLYVADTNNHRIQKFLRY